MDNYRVDAAFDKDSGRYYATLYFPADSKAPIARTLAVYDTADEALERINRMFRNLFPLGGE